MAAETTRLLRLTPRGPRYGLAVGKDGLASVDDVVKCLRRDVEDLYAVARSSLSATTRGVRGALMTDTSAPSESTQCDMWIQRSKRWSQVYLCMKGQPRWEYTIR